ncbi:LacI family DNA-binding transcriptional regulator [Limibacter armeniacum]|uniref:LacI family DNA-binding transcriptional regulator n=1 Tax=Limibacter armeniacum TaxID=466084 RepID=UPI002FE548B1
MKKKRNTTIKDLARRLDISVSTVSRALRDAPDVNYETKQQVLALAEQLNYKRNMLATSLVSKRTYNIGVIVPELSVPFFGYAISGIQQTLYEYGYKMLIGHTSEQFKLEQDSVQMMIDNQVDGIIISVSKDTEDYQHLHQAKEEDIPVVMFDRVIPELQQVFSNVIVDDKDGAFNATAHLIEHGYKRIAHISGPKNLYISQKRIEGYKEALEMYNIGFQSEYLIHCNLRVDAATATEQLLRLPEPPDAIFAINDPVAFEILHYLNELGVKVPEEIGVVGYTGDPMGRLFNPSLTSIRQPSAMMGSKAAELLIKEINHKHNPATKNLPFEHSTIILPTELITGRSSVKKRL